LSSFWSRTGSAAEDLEADVPVYEHDDLDAKEFAAHIDAIDAIVLKSGLLEMER